MKNVDEYTADDMQEVIDHACKMSMAVISEVWHESKDMERPDDEDIHAVKKAMQVLQISRSLKPIRPLVANTISHA